MNQVAPRIDKGKQRAVVDLEEPSESTPLLGSSSQQPGLLVSLEAEPQDHWEIDWPTVIKSLLYGALLTLIIILGLLAYAASRLRRDITLDEAVRWELTGLRIVDVSTGGEDSSPSMSYEVQVLVQGVDLGYLSDWERKLASWGIRTIDTVRVSSAPVQARIWTASGSEDVAAVTVKPFDLKLPQGPEHKEPVTFIAHVQPTVNASRALNLLDYAWSEQEVNAEALVTDIRVEGIQGWRQLIKVDLDVFKLPLSYELPNIPFIPPPPAPLLPSLLSAINLTRIEVDSNHTVGAIATIPNPLPFFNLPHFSFSMTPSFMGYAYLPAVNSPTKHSEPSAPLPMVEATTGEIRISSTSKQLVVPIRGDVLPIPPTASASRQMSRFLSTYLGGLPSPVIVSIPGLNISLPYDFPAPHPKPKVLEDVKLSNVKFVLRGLEAIVSGSVDVIVAFPKGIHLDVLVHRVAVDVIAFDGPVPELNDSSRNAPNSMFPFPKVPISIPHIELPWPWNRHYTHKPSPPEHPLPEPLPENAFARIRPEEWLNASSVPELLNEWITIEKDLSSPNDDAGTRLKVHSEFRDVPVKILPGRDHVFRKFVRKFLFSDETLTGLQGFAAVAVSIPGLLEGDEQEGELELLDLPFDGAVFVGKGIF